jgi:hypothetical protein
MDIARRKFISTASGTPAIGAAAVSTALPGKCCRPGNSNLTSDQPEEQLCASIDGLRDA